MKRIAVTDDSSLAEAVAFCQRRDAGDSNSVLDKLEAARRIVEDVRKRGDAAVTEYGSTFDKVSLSPTQFELSHDEIEQAISTVDRSLVAALERAHDNIRRFHEKNLRQSWEEQDEDGTLMGQKVTPIERVGVYVPGFTAFYPSSALMNLVPAKVAGVRDILMVSPPSWNGAIHPLTLAAARIGGATRIFRVGGVQAIAALAYGTQTIPRVYKITGPGNIYVTLAKRLVSSVCDIDKEAGPSDVVVIADDKADPEWIAAELMSQAEHNEDSPTTLIALSEDKVNAVENAIESFLPRLSRAPIIRKSLADEGLAIIARNLDDAIYLANAIAPEHLSIQVEVPVKVFDKIQNAGAIMIGGGTPVAVSDYYAGPNHILPTGGQARFASPLTVEDFRKVVNFVSYSRARLRHDAEDIIRLAEAEGLTAHALSVELRR